MITSASKKITALILTLVLLLSATGLLFVAAENTDEFDTRNLGLTGVANARELGGYVTADGRTIASGKLLRTARLHDATEEDINKLANEYDVAKVLDLRTLAEAIDKPDAAIPGAENIRFPVKDVISEGIEIATLLAEVTSGTMTVDFSKLMEVVNIALNGPIYSYMEDETVGYVTDLGSVLMWRMFFDELLVSEGQTVLFHSTAGKDRTGVASILLLSALGVDKETILEDYMASNEYYQEDINAIYNKVMEFVGLDCVASDVALAKGVSKGWAEAVYDAIDKNYGGMQNFLRFQCGLSQKDLETLRAAYLA